MQYRQNQTSLPECAMLSGLGGQALSGVSYRGVLASEQTNQTGHFCSTLRPLVSNTKVKHGLPPMKGQHCNPRMTSDLTELHRCAMCCGTNIRPSLYGQV